MDEKYERCKAQTVKSEKNATVRVLIQMRDLRIGNGIAACIMNYYEYTVQNGYQIDFLLNRNIDSPYMDIVKKYGSKVYVLPCDTGKPNKKNWDYIKTIIDKKYDVLHVNLSGLNALESLMIAKFNGVKKRIYHAHNPKETSSIKAIIRSNIYEVPSVYFSNQYVACSSTAGDSLFGKGNYTILKNAMNTKRFEYDEKARKILRKELGIENNFVVGVVGRLAEQKNPYFMIDIFEKVKEKNPKACLIWAGDGQLKSPIERYIQKKNLEKFILMLGSRKDVDKLYSAMDAFLLPSKFEGLGLVFIEAQISGLQCFGSDKIPTDVEVSSRMHRISLSKTANEWADEIVRDTILNNNSREMLKRTGFEIEDVVSSLVKIYRM